MASANDVRAIATTGQARQVVGVDLSAVALKQARNFPAAGGETYVEADLFALPPEWRCRFDWVFEHTCFCAIDPVRREDYVTAVADALHEDGRLLAIFYLRPWSGGEQKPPGGGPPFGITKPELGTLFAKRFRLVEEWTPIRAFPGKERREIVRLLQRTDASE